MDLEQLGRWLQTRLGLSESPSIEPLLTSSVGNSLFVAASGDDKWVVRCPPPVKNAPSANDMSREWRLLNALEGTDVPHARPLLFGDDLDDGRAPFIVISFVDGWNPGEGLEPPFDADPSTRHQFGLEMVDAIAALANVDWEDRGLGDFGRPDGFLERQVGRWLRQLDSYRTRDIEHLDEVAAWLESRRPEMGRPGIIHGDYSVFNTLFHHGAPARMAAVIDWDTSTIGDPMVDLGKLLSGWAGDGDEPLIEGRGIGVTDGLPSRAELLERYAARTGRDVSAVEYFEVLGLFKLACIIEGVYYQAQRGQRSAEQGAQMGELVPKLIDGAARIARGSALPARS